MDLKTLNDWELISIQQDIRSILRNRKISEESVLKTLKNIKSSNFGTCRFTKLTLALEKEGFPRDAIANRVIDMVNSGVIENESGCPIGEADSEDNPIYPLVEGKRYIHVCYLK